MKRFMVFFILISAILMIPEHSNSQSIELISRSYSISGRCWGFCEGGYPFTNVYSELNSPTPVYSPYDTNSFATGNIGISSAFLSAGFSIYEQGQSSAEIMFRPIGSSFLDILFGAERSGADGQWDFYLKDYTLGNTLLDRNYMTTTNFLMFYGSFSIPVDPTHDYSLKVSAMGAGGDLAGARVTMTLVPTSEPVTMLLLGFGLIGIAGIRRRIRK